MFVPFFVNGNNISLFQCIAWISFLEVCKWKNHLFLTCECWCYYDHELYLDLSFELFWQCRPEKNLQKISNCQSNNEDAKGVCCCFLLKSIALQDYPDKTILSQHYIVKHTPKNLVRIQNWAWLNYYKDCGFISSSDFWVMN